MSTSLVIKEIKAFLSRKEPEVLCIRGRWGVGKTFTWNDALNSVRQSGAVPLSHYSYVSLFGLNSLSALKLAIFEGIVPLSGTKSLVPDIDSLQAFVESGASQWRKLANFASKLPIINKFAGDDAMGSLSFLTVRNMIICLDDLERKGAGLSLSDVLGLASELRERRGCKIVFLLNDEQLGGDKAAFESYLEKVVDISLLYEPTSAEAVAIAQTGPSPVSKRTAELCSSLGIRNIRVIKKIDRHISDVEKLTKGRRAGVFDQASASVALFGWSHYQPTEAPSLEHIRAYSAYREAKDATAQQITWNAQLAAYGYTSTNEFDLELLDGVVRGYFDEAAVARHADELDAQLKATEADGSFEDAWGLYHDSFDDNEKVAVDTIYKSFLANIPYISPLNLNGTVRLLKDLGQAAKAKTIIAEYVEKRSKERAFFDLEEYSFSGDIDDVDVRAAFAKKLAGTPEKRDIKAMVLGLKNGWNDKTLNTLAALKPADYRKLFKDAREADLRRMISGCLQFGSIVNASEPMKKIVAHARGALALIGAESRVNARRVERYGVHPTAKAAPKPKPVKKTLAPVVKAAAPAEAAPIKAVVRKRLPRKRVQQP